ncbi:MAG: 1-acyl-sn-glycerol-3-phosphate acyltransferase [Bacteroidaceae bacterium]|nr:1-acyl-sn-glycerol-3-phosphate acyltransferase [Bacteroidaceae bacterium]
MGLKQKVFGFIYYKVLGWKSVVNTPDFNKCIICTAPHTTNWDLFIGKLFIGAVGRESGFLMKSDWFFWPLGPIFRWMGGIPVNRSKNTSLTQRVIELAKTSDRFILTITPEGTRKANPKWKRGFWFIAKGANLPIVLCGIDYEKKEIRSEKVFIPSDDIEADMREIKMFFKDFKGYHPENFSISEII